MLDLRFGDPICYRYIGPHDHDGPLMYVGRCGHQWNTHGGLIDILDLTGTYGIKIDHKDASMWQACHHLTKMKHPHA